METHVHCFCVLWLQIVSYDRTSSGIVSSHWGPGLAVSHFIEDFSGWNSFSCINIHVSNLYFCRQVHNVFHDLCCVEHRSILGGGKRYPWTWKNVHQPGFLPWIRWDTRHRCGLPKPCRMLRRLVRPVLVKLHNLKTDPLFSLLLLLEMLVQMWWRWGRWA